MINKHPEFLANMIKPRKDRTKRPQMAKVLASGRGGSQKLHVTARQVEYAEKQFDKDLATGLEASIQRIPAWLDMFRELNPTAYTDINYDLPLYGDAEGTKRFLRCMVICPFLQDLLPKLCFKIFGLDGSALQQTGPTWLQRGLMPSVRNSFQGHLPKKTVHKLCGCSLQNQVL